MDQAFTATTSGCMAEGTSGEECPEDGLKLLPPYRELLAEHFPDLYEQVMR